MSALSASTILYKASLADNTILKGHLHIFSFTFPKSVYF
jgi:hypothetical protein